ncbi:hypothetical protein TIFTF001_011291 [Ficus carica]|uniref:Uncharacterized protein n=1 Tax=Ficus carica TaxID=3494 RepID=A0AA88D588_FICCA|nr:hypothetical protein TIFTF001_011291 [Ficus carica]
MAYKNKKETNTPSILGLFLSCFFGFDAAENAKIAKAPSRTGPEAAMVAAAKHFSSKVRLI